MHTDPKTIQGVADLYVLAIGANGYHNLSSELHELYFADSDAGDVAETFKKAGSGFYPDPPIVKRLVENQVTADDIETAFKELAAQVRATDVFVFYIAGHGETIDGDYYFLPPSIDSSSNEAKKGQGFGPKKLTAWFAMIKARKSIWIFDTCQSGSAGKLFPPDAIANDTGYKRLSYATGRAIFMAAGEQEAAIEGYRNHGLLTYALLEALAKAGNGDEVRLFDLDDYVKTRVRALSHDQSVCPTRGPNDYCQDPIVDVGKAENFPIVRRYRQVLAKLDEEGAGFIPLKPNYVVRETTALLGSGGSRASGQIEEGVEVTVLKTEDGLAEVAQDGKLLGYVDTSKLLKLKN